MHMQWKPTEDALLRSAIAKHERHGAVVRQWTLIAQSVPNRSGKQCRERWHNHLNPSLRKKKWSLDEDRRLTDLVDTLGTSWTKISKHPVLKGRSDNHLKNRYTTLKKRLDFDHSTTIHKARKKSDPSVSSPPMVVGSADVDRMIENAFEETDAKEEEEEEEEEEKDDDDDDGSWEMVQDEHDMQKEIFAAAPDFSEHAAALLGWTVTDVPIGERISFTTTTNLCPPQSTNFFSATFGSPMEFTQFNVCT